MLSKKYTISIFLICIILFLSFLLIYKIIFRENPFTISGYSSYIIKEKNVQSAVDKLIKEKRALLELKNNNTCYWIRPTYNKTHNLIEIREYDRTLGECIGTVKSVSYVISGHSNRMLSSDCICGDQEYTLELKNIDNSDGIEISKSHKKISLSINEILQNILKNFTQKKS